MMSRYNMYAARRPRRSYFEKGKPVIGGVRSEAASSPPVTPLTRPVSGLSYDPRSKGSMASSATGTMASRRTWTLRESTVATSLEEVSQEDDEAELECGNAVLKTDGKDMKGKEVELRFYDDEEHIMAWM